MQSIQKKKVGHLNTIPQNLVPLRTVGGYVFASDENDLYICGTNQFNLSASPIGELQILPITKNKLVEFNSDEGRIADVFDLDDEVHYVVTYIDYSYVFLDIRVALDFAGTIIEYKADGLREDMLLDKMVNEI